MQLFDMTMENMKYSIICLVFCALFCSCDDFLDITPDGQQKRDELLQTKDGIEDAMYGAYASMRGSNLYGRELSIASLEIMAQTLFVKDGKGISALAEYDYKHSDVESLMESIWTDMYHNISNVNSVLDCGLISNAKDYPYTLYKGEALGLRAFMHFDLMRLFCKQYTLDKKADGIPYATEFSLKTPEFESLEANYTHVLADLLKADSLLDLCKDKLRTDTRNYMRDQQTHFNQYAVKATLARVYLNMGNTDKALEYAQQVIRGSGRKLNAKTEMYGDVAGRLSPNETVFGIYYGGFFSVVSATLQKMTSFYSLNPKANAEEIYNCYDPSLKDMIGGQDFRWASYFSYSDNGGSSVLRLSKLTDPYEENSATSKRPSSDILGINLIRLPEMYLIAAECLLGKGRAEEAQQTFDSLLASRGITPTSDASIGLQLTQDLINHEFYKEFVGEGQIWFNYKRQNMDIKSWDGQTEYTASDAVYVLPIPEIEYEYRY